MASRRRSAAARPGHGPLLAATLLVFGAHAAAASCPGGATTAAFAAPGRFAVGVRTVALLDESRDTPAHGSTPARAGRRLETEVWYPAEEPAGATPVRDADAARGRFPLIVDAHGFGDFRDSRAYYAVALASRGYVVAAPEFPVTSVRSGAPRNVDTPNQPGDVSFLITVLLDLARDRASWLGGRLDRRRIGVSGYSNGGTTALLVGFHPSLRDRRVRAVATIATGACYLTDPFFDHARPPLLVVEGAGDVVVGGDPRKVFRLAHSRRTLVSLLAAGHAGFLGFFTQPSETSYDSLICGGLSQPEVDAFVFDPAVLGGAAAGIDPSGCSLPCQGGLPPGRPMQAVRQHQLTAAAVTAFFDTTLERSKGARCVLERELARENADVRVERAVRSRLPRS